MKKRAKKQNRVQCIATCFLVHRSAQDTTCKQETKQNLVRRSVQRHVATCSMVHRNTPLFREFSLFYNLSQTQ